MPIDFFEKEVEKTQERFNRTYGQMIVCNLKARQAAILSIINLGLLCRRIISAKEKDEVRGEIQDFIRIRNTLNIHFNVLEMHLKERRQHGNSDGHQGRADDGTGNERRVSNNL